MRINHINIHVLGWAYRWNMYVLPNYDNVYALLSVFAPENTLKASKLVNVTVELKATDVELTKVLTFEVLPSSNRSAKPKIRIRKLSHRKLHLPG